MAIEMLGRANDTILVLSPHLDDAVLSVGGIMEQAAIAGMEVVAGTIFTADPPETLSPFARELHELWDLGDNPYALRRAEDVAAVASLRARHIHGGLPDAIYRNDASGNALYPSREAIFGGPAAKDGIQAALRDLIAGWMRDLKPSAILCPMAVGRHVDHLTTLAAFRQVEAETNLFLYEDLPYSTGLFPVHAPDSVAAAIKRASWATLEPRTLAVGADNKIAAVRMYASQIADIFPGRDAERDLKQYMLSTDGWVERLWAITSRRG